MAKKKYDDLDKNELVRLLEARDRRDATRFGLVWETNEIERDKALNDDFVILEIDKALSHGGGPWRNLIIEGDNFDALRYLRMTFAGRIKCVLIDPPYNTGGRDFIYNDRFVEKEHLWRHSLWIEYLYQRLHIARDLLTNDGVILVHIGEEEVDRLGCLMDQVFPGRKVGKFVWRTRSGARVSQNHFLSIDHEYVLCYANPGFEFAGSAKTFADYSNPDNDPRGDWANFNLTKGQSYKERARSFYPIQNPENGIWYPPNPDRVWAFSSETRIKEGQRLVGMSMEQVIKEKKVLWPEDDRIVTYTTLPELLEAIDEGTAPRHLRRGLPGLEEWVGRRIGYGMPRYKMHKSELNASYNPLSTWFASSSDPEIDASDACSESIEVGTTAEGATLLTAMLGTKDFPYPKPLSLTQAIIQQTTRRNDIVLDFFAGSGTTGHAVLAINQEDEGERRFILVSNREATEKTPETNVCKDVCRRRLEAAIKGYSYTTKSGPKQVAGLGGDFAYLTCGRISPGRMMEIDHAHVWTALQLTHCDALKEYCEGSFQRAGNDEQLLIYVPRFNGSHIKELRKAIGESLAVIVYSWQPELVRQRLQDMLHVQVEAVPESLTRRFGMKV